jgi:hypothetical protein
MNAVGPGVGIETTAAVTGELASLDVGRRRRAEVGGGIGDFSDPRYHDIRRQLRPDIMLKLRIG